MLPGALAALLGLAPLLLGGTLAMLPRMERRARIAARLRALWPETATQRASGSDWATLQLAVRLGTILLHGRLLPRGTAEAWRATLAGANFRGEQALAVFAGMKALLLPGLPLLALLACRSLGFEEAELLAAAMAGALGLLAPDAMLRRLRLRRQRAAERSLPDALDMMVICAEAGLGLEAGIERVAREIAPVHRVLAEELTLVANELRIGTDRRTALVALGGRLDSEPLKRLGATLVQSMQFGTPLAQALRLLAAEMRQDQITQFEARAARLPVLMTLPLIVFILPTVFLVMAGPAILQVLRSF